MKLLRDTLTALRNFLTRLKSKLRKKSPVETSEVNTESSSLGPQRKKHRPIGIDTFTVYMHDDIDSLCHLTNQSSLPIEFLPELVHFLFTAYAPIVLFENLESTRDGRQLSFWIAAEPGALDLAHLQVTFAQREPGWHIYDGILLSPHPSKLEYDEVIELMFNPVESAIDVIAA